MLKPQTETVTRRVPSAAPFYLIAAMWVIGSLSLKMYKLSSWLIMIALSIIGYVLLRHYLFKDKEETIEVEKPRSYYSEVQQQFIESGTASLNHLQQLNAGVRDPQVQADVAELIDTSDQILDYVYSHEKAAGRLRKFTAYYLPTVEKLLGRYRELQDAETANAAEGAAKIRDILKTTLDAFRTQLNALYDTDTLDINSEVKVLEQIYVQEGLIDPDDKQAQ